VGDRWWTLCGIQFPRLRSITIWNWRWSTTVARGQSALPADVSLAAGSNRKPSAASNCVRRIGATGLKNPAA